MASYPGYAGPMGLRSPIFGSPVTPPNLLGLTTDPDARRMRQIQGVGDTLTALGIGLMGQGTSTTPQSPLQGLAQGLAGAQQMAGQRTQEANQSERMDLARGQYGMEQQKFQDDQKRQALSDQYEQARQAEMEKLIVSLPPDQQSAARANPDAFWKAYAESKFPKEGTKPGGVQEYEYAKGQGYKGSLLDYEREKAAAGRAPQQAPQDPADIQEYKFAVGQGFKGSYMDYLASKKGQGMSVTLPDGTTMQVGGSVKPPNESQMAAAQRAQLVQSGIDQLEGLYSNPDINAYRVAGADTLAQTGPLGNVAANNIKSDAEQQYSAAKASALEGLAAAVTGAGVSTDQFTRYTQMLPDITDKPETKRAKLKAARDFLKVLLKNSGSAGQAVLDNLPKPSDTPAAPAAPAPSKPAVTQSLPAGFN